MATDAGPIDIAAARRRLWQTAALGRVRFPHTKSEVASIVRNGATRLDAPHRATLLALVQALKDEDLADYDTRAHVGAEQIAARIGAAVGQVRWHIQNLAAKVPGGPYLLDLSSDDPDGPEVYDLWPTFRMLPAMQAVAASAETD